MTVKIKKHGLPPELDTSLEMGKTQITRKNSDHSNSNRRELDTPKHCNKGQKGVSGSMPPFQPHSYVAPSYSQPAPAPGGPPPPHHMHHGPYPYGPSVMISPGNGSFGHGYPPPPFHPFHLNNSHNGYPPFPPNQPSGPPGQHTYGRHFPPPQHPYGDMNHRRPQYNAPPPGDDFSSVNGQAFARSVSVSASFSENKPKIPTPYDGREGYEERDDASVASRAESDASWKQLNQVASIEEEKFRHQEGRFGATTPVEGIYPNLSSDISQSPRPGGVNNPRTKNGGTADVTKAKPDLTPSKLGPLTSLSSVASLQEPLDTTCSKDELDLRLCSTGSSGLLFYDETSTSSKRPREERGELESSNRSQGGETRNGPSPPPNFSNLTMKDTSCMPPTKKRCATVDEDSGRDIYQAFSMESINSSYGKEESKLPALGTIRRPVATNPSEEEQTLTELDENEARELDRNMPSWDITGQDSFGGGFSVNSNLTDGQGDDVLGKSFSFCNESEFPSATNAGVTDIPMPKIMDNSSMNPIIHKNNVDMSHGPPTSQSGEEFPPAAATWVTNTSRGSFSMDAEHTNHMRPHFPPHPFPGQVPPPQFDGHHSFSRPGPSFGMPRNQQSYLPLSFRPPLPGMAGPPMSRTAPPPVYLMPSLPEGASGMNGMRGQMPPGMSKNGGFTWTKSDDARLSEVLKKFKNPKNWEKVAKEFGSGRTAKECNERWIRYLKPGVRKGQWQDHEDLIVIEAVTTCKEQPFTRWSDLAQKLPGRVGKQIRDRWVNHLNPNINHMPFTKEDDMKLWDGHKQLGKRWVEISTKYFNSSRSENHIKNRWYSASFKKFVATEFGSNAYVPCDKKHSRKGASKDTNAKK